ncbi:MAG: hypothetical protein IH984_07450 [Planctomycetes bacterium]|nr:hypothetical protein [Planctomycetota bacterium]
MVSNELKTVNEIAKMFGLAPSRIRYLVDARVDIEPVTRIAHVRMFDTATVRKIALELEKINTRRKAVLA